MLIFEHLINGLALGSIYALVALGYSLAFGVLQLINFAHSEIYMTSAFVAYFLDKSLGLSQKGLLGLAMLALLTLVFGGFLAVLIERVAYRPLRKSPKVNILITAIGISLFLQYFAQLVFGADPKFFSPGLENRVLISGAGLVVTLYDVIVFGLTVVALVVLNLVIYRTLLGKAMRAISFNTHYAELIGIPVNRIISLTFFVGGALAAVACLLVPLKYPKIDPMMGLMMGLKSFVAAVLGGIGHLQGAVVGAILLGVVEQLVAAYLSSTYKDAFAFLILIYVLLMRPEGLFGQRRVEKV